MPSARRLYRGMTTRLYSHPIYLEHITPPGHPERPDRLRAIARALDAEEFSALDRRQSPTAEASAVLVSTSAELSRTPGKGGARDGNRAHRCRHLDEPEELGGCADGGGCGQRRGRRRLFGRRRQRLRRGAAARPPRRARHRDGLLPVQQRGDRRPPRAGKARRRARRHRRLGRPSRQRHAGHLLGRSIGALLLDPPDAALSRHRRQGRARRRQHRQRAAVARHRQRSFSRGASIRACCRRSTISGRT